MARDGRRFGGKYGPPEWDFSNKPYVKKSLRQQNEDRPYNWRTPVYFSEWANTGRFMKRDPKMKSRLYREAAKLLADIKGELIQHGGDLGREAAGNLYVEFESDAGWHNDRPFLHISERGAPSERKFWVANWKAQYSDRAWHNYMSERASFENKHGKGTFPDHDKYQDQKSLRDRVIDRYFVRNPDAVRYGRL